MFSSCASCSHSGLFFFAIGLFAALLVPGVTSGTYVSVVIRASELFVVARVVYWVIYLLDYGWARSFVWLVGFTATLALYGLPLLALLN